jgi:hypothetical protein
MTESVRRNLGRSRTRWPQRPRKTPNRGILPTEYLFEKGDAGNEWPVRYSEESEF